MKTFIQLIFPALLVAGCAIAVSAADPVVSNVRALQRTGTRLVDIRYDVTDADEDVLTVNLTASVTNHPIQTTSLVGDVNTNRVTPGVNRLITWDAGADWSGQFSTGVCFTVTANDGKFIYFTPTCKALVGTNDFGKVFIGKSMKWVVSGISPAGKYKITYALNPPGYVGTVPSFPILSGSFSILNTYYVGGTARLTISILMTDAAGNTYIGTCSGQTIAVPYDGTEIEI